MFNLFIIRHGDPDYENDCLTLQGKTDAEILAKRLENIPFTRIFSSPYNRAYETAKPTAEMQDKKIETLDFIKEFIGMVTEPEGNEFPWHISGDFYTRNYNEFNENDFYKNPRLVTSDFTRLFEETKKELDIFLASYGFIRTAGGFTNETNPNENIAFFCHGGKGVLLLALILDLPIMQTWRHFFKNTASITEINFVKNGDIFFPECTLFGDNSHLINPENKFIAKN